VHDLIAVPDGDQFILELLDTPEMQRLRRIRQLGVSLFTYQGAEHSRFTHSLGVYHCVSRLLDALRLNHQGETALLKTIDEITRPVKAAGLLHDIGHGPFSHALERFTNAKHEKYTSEIIRDDSTEVNKTLQRMGIPPDAVADIINKTYQPSLAVDIISSELDADRMDYLLRDSVMCGVNYGRFDIEWMMHVMHAATVKIGDNEVMKLTADARKGVHAIEQYVMARLYMYEQVYFHKTTRAIEGLLINTLSCAHELLRDKGWTSPQGTHPMVEKFIRGEEGLSLGEYILLDDFAVLSTLAQWARMSPADADQRELAELSRKLVDRSRPFGCIEISANDARRQRELGHWETEIETQMPELNYRWYIDDTDSTYYKGILYNMSEKKEPEEEANTTIFVLEDSEPVRVESASTILEKLSGQRSRHVRVYYDRDCEASFKPLFEKHGIM